MTLNLNRGRRGATLIVVLGGIIVASAVLLAIAESSGSSQKATSQFIDDQGVYYSAQGATDLAASEVWGAYNVRRAANPSLDFPTYLNSRFAFVPISPGIDPLADQMRIGTNDVLRATVTDWGNLKLGTRIISKFYIYQRARNIIYPGTNTVQQYNYDIMIAVESQKDLGYQSAALQATALNSTGAIAVAGATASASTASLTDVANPNWVASYMTVSNPPTYAGFNFGLLTKNVQCTLCHLHVGNAAKAFNKDPSKFNTFPRVKVGSTSFMGVNTGAGTVIEGSLYQRNRLEDDASAALISANDAASRLRGVALNPDGTIQQTVVLNSNNTVNLSASGGTTTVVCTNTPSTSNGAAVAPAINGNFYGGYPTDPNMQSDGILPNDDFPSPFPDIPRSEDNNRPNHKIEADEVALAKADAVAASDPTQPGSVKGGVAVMMQTGTQYTATVLPNTGQAANISTGFTGNVILTGTVNNPILLDGKVVIDGDLIIRGYVQGTGQIFTTGNIYIPGDVIYKDRVDSLTIPGHTAAVSQEAFGSDSQNKANLLGLVSGKNIVIGDYLSQVTNWSQSDPNFYAPRKVDANGNVVTLQGQPEPGRILTYAKDKYLNPSQVTVMPGSIKASDGNTYSTYSQPNFTMFQLANFNQLEYTRTLSALPNYSSLNTYDPTNPLKYQVPNIPANNPNTPYDANYIPRFYSFYPYNANNPSSTPVYVATTGWQQSPQVGGNGGAWSTAEQRFNLIRHSGDPINFTDLANIPAIVQSPASLEKKNVINVHPDWISPSTMMKIISSEELTRATGSRRVDGLLYTSNALLAIERSLVQVYNPTTNTWTNSSSRGSGNLTINGAVIAPDMGVMTPDGSFNVNYDQRVAGLVNLPPSAITSSGTTSAANWGMTRKGFTKNVGQLPDTNLVLNLNNRGNGSNGSGGSGTSGK